MSVDISRVSFDASKHYSRLIHQQGRVTLDADANEQASVLLHYVRSAVADILGPSAAPRAASGFAVSRIAKDPKDLAVAAGRLYVDGILVENELATTYLTQPEGYVDPDGAAVPPGHAFVAYLRVWEREITAIQDPAVREVALGDTGPDTAARAKVVWQVALHGLGNNDPGAAKAVPQLQAWLDGVTGPAGLMAAQARHEPSEPVPACTIAPQAQFRGPENQLYRVQIHTSGAGAAPGAGQTAPRGGTRRAGRGGAARGQDPVAPTATFVWSRENAAIAIPVQAMAGSLVTLQAWGRDSRLGIDVGDWVELVDDATAVHVADEIPTAPPQRIHQVVALDIPDRTVTLDADPNTAQPGAQPPLSVTGDPALHPFLRRWDHLPPEGADALSVVLDTWIPLEDGVEVMFTNPASSDPKKGQDTGHFRRGDYWLVPARTIPGDVLWPQDEDGQAALPPHGVRYHYATLAYLPAGKGDAVSLVATFAPLFP